MLCPLIKEGCEKENCAWWLSDDGGGCSIALIPWIVVWLERIASKL
jgi:hypothetical protein